MAKSKESIWQEVLSVPSGISGMKIHGIAARSSESKPKASDCYQKDCNFESLVIVRNKFHVVRDTLSRHGKGHYDNSR